MARPDLPSRPSRLHAVLGRRAAASAASIGPRDGWPPVRGSTARAHDPPTLPLALPDQGGGRASGGHGRLLGLLRRVLPESWRGARVDPGRPGATALVLVAAAAAVVAAVGVWTERPQAQPVADLPSVTVTEGLAAGPEPASAAVPASTADTPAPPAPAPPLVVSVSGKVHRPGLVQVPEGARVADVLAAAGGALPGTDLATLNLARRVVDGEQVAVGVPAAPDAIPSGPPPSAPGGAAAAPVGKVDLNSATAAQLDALPGIGPVTAARILEWRTRNGRFARVEQLREVEGIGERRYGQLRELVRV